MYAVVNHLHFSSPATDFVPGLQEEGVHILAAQPGFEGFYFVKEADDRGIVIILWASAEAAANGAKVFGPTWFARHIAPNLAGEQVRTLGEVLVHRTK